MLTTTNTIHPDCDVLHLRTDDIEGSVFFDIETTGFRAESSHLYLIGLAVYTPSGWQITQLFAEKPTEEAALLRTFYQMVRPYRQVITFNGNRFDIPYLEAKYAQYGLSSPFSELTPIDIYRDIRHLRHFLGLEHMNQTSLERFLDLHREDRYDGGKLISVYRQYVKAEDDSLLQLLLLHNREDVEGMFSLIQMYAYLQLQTRPQGEIDVQLLQYADAAFALELRWQLAYPLPIPYREQNEFVSVTIRDHTAVLLTPVYVGDLLYFFPDYKNYDYFPLEDRAIPKKLSVFADKSRRESARPETSYTHHDGMFLWQPSASFTPAFRSDYHSKTFYFELPHTFESDRDFSADYIQLLLKSLL